VLAKERPETKIIVCEPEDAQLLASGITQLRNSDGTPAAPHPTFKPHPMQGWTPDFVPKLTDDVVAMKVIDRILPISGPDAIRCSKDLATQEGIFVGITSGGTFAGALKVAAEAEKGANILYMLPDTGERTCRPCRRSGPYRCCRHEQGDRHRDQSRGGQMPAAVTTISRLGRSVLTLFIRPLSPALDANESKERPHALLQHPLQMFLIFLSTLESSELSIRMASSPCIAGP
jgi:hypothetical protein